MDVMDPQAARGRRVERRRGPLGIRRMDRGGGIGTDLTAFAAIHHLIMNKRNMTL
jgi:hypothetical protein